MDKKITLKTAYQILEDCSAVIIDDDVLIYPSLDDLTGEGDNQFLRLKWEDEGLEFHLRFEEEDNQEIIISGSSIVLKDTKGDEAQLTILVPKDLE